MHNDPASPGRLPSPPALTFGPDGAPESTAFGDVYFSRAGGLLETEQVFLAGCGLPEAWRGRDLFTIGELGFGSGLNALAAWRAWRANRAHGAAALHFVSFEAHPMTRADAARALGAFPELAPLTERLLKRWPYPAFGPQRLWFAEDGFCLTLHVGDAAESLARLEGRFDAWFLDGFAPSRNPALWTDAVFARIAALSAPGARLATYSTAGHVRRGLMGAGFVVEKRPGFAAKRERLEARLPGPAAASAPRPERIAILGAGIAGGWLAQAAMRRQVRPVVFEAGDEFGAGASGNPAALVMPRLDRGENGLARMFRAAYLAALDGYAGLPDAAFERIGVHERPRQGREAALDDVLANPPLPPALLQAADAGGALHPLAGLVRPAHALPALFDGAEIVWRTAVARVGAQDGRWRLHDAAGAAIADADAVILANGAHVAALAQAADWPIEFSRGQVEWAKAAGIAGQARAAGPYAAPVDGGVLFGATFNRLASLEPVSPDDVSRAANLASLAALAPEWAARVDPASIISRASVRAATPDRAPIAGLLGGHAGLGVVGGLGARGFLLAPLLAETVIAAIMGEPPVLDSQALAAVDPARFARRRARREQQD